MQINSNGITANTNANSKQKTADVSTNDASQKNTPVADKDSVELSREAQTLKKLEAQIMSSPDMDLQRVESIRQAIADGSYTVDAEAIALKMLQSDTDAG